MKSIETEEEAKSMDIAQVDDSNIRDDTTIDFPNPSFPPTNSLITVNAPYLAFAFTFLSQWMP